MNKLTKIAVCLAVSMSGTGFVASVSAATATSTVTVSATVIDSCTVTSQALPFGAYNSISGDGLDTSALASPTCTRGTAYAVSLNAGIGADATETARKLSGMEGASLTYGIYADAGRSSVWGSGAGGTTQIFGTGNGEAQPMTMYGRIPGAQTVRVGTYTDTVTVTVTY